MSFQKKETEKNWVRGQTWSSSSSSHSLSPSLSSFSHLPLTTWSLGCIEFFFVKACSTFWDHDFLKWRSGGRIPWPLKRFSHQFFVCFFTSRTLQSFLSSFQYAIYWWEQWICVWKTLICLLDRKLKKSHKEACRKNRCPDLVAKVVIKHLRIEQSWESRSLHSSVGMQVHLE